MYFCSFVSFRPFTFLFSKGYVRSNFFFVRFFVSFLLFLLRSFVSKGYVRSNFFSFVRSFLFLFVRLFLLRSFFSKVTIDTKKKRK